MDNVKIVESSRGMDDLYWRGYRAGVRAAYGESEDNPCMPDCPHRCGQCHAYCPAYKKWNERNDKRRAENLKKSNLIDDCVKTRQNIRKIHDHSVRKR